MVNTALFTGNDFYRALYQLLAGSRIIEPAGQTEKGLTGKIFSVRFGDASVVRQNGKSRPAGLVLYATGGAARVKLTVGVVGGRGAEIRREFEVDTAGYHLTVAGWGSAQCEVVAVGGNEVIVHYAWTSIPPQVDKAQCLRRVDTVLPGTFEIPDGAIAVTPGSDDAAWQWQTKSTSGAAIVIASGVTSGEKSDVLGAQYTAVLSSNTVVWELWAP